MKEWAGLESSSFIVIPCRLKILDSIQEPKKKNLLSPGTYPEVGFGGVEVCLVVKFRWNAYHSPPPKMILISQKLWGVRSPEPPSAYSSVFRLIHSFTLKKIYRVIRVGTSEWLIQFRHSSYLISVGNYHQQQKTSQGQFMCRCS